VLEPEITKISGTVADTLFSINPSAMAEIVYEDLPVMVCASESVFVDAVYV